MYPILLRLGPVTIHTYGVLVALGAAAALAVILHNARRLDLDTGAITDLAVYLVVFGLIGARLLYVFMFFEQFRGHLWDILRIWNGGLVFVGGLTAGILTALAYMGIRGLPYMTTADALAPGLALGQAIGRLGCLSAGCCYGRAADLPWAVVFTDPLCQAPLGVPLHPSQLYSAGFLFLLFLLLMLLLPKRRFAGQVFWTYALVHGLGRFWLESYRADLRGMEWLGGLSTTQATSAALVIIAGLFLAVLSRSGRDRKDL